MNIGILIFDDVEELDFVGPFEVFAQASRIVSGIEVSLLSKENREVRCRYGLRVQPDHSLTNCPPLDLLIVPGGKGAREYARYDSEIISFVRRHASQKQIASVCTGALILAEAGLLKGHKATTHWSALDTLREYPGVEVVGNTRYVREGNVSTSAGISAGIDLALDIVKDLHGKEVAKKVARSMEYPYDDS